MNQLSEQRVGSSIAGRTTLGYLLYVVAACCFALNGTVAKSILTSGVDAARLSQLRVSGAFVVMLVLFAATRPATLRLTRREIPLLIAYGVAGIAMTQWMYFVALQYLPVGITLLIEFTAPFMVALWFRFGMKQPVRKMVWIALAIAVVGLGLVGQVWQGFMLNGIGVAFGFGAALALAIFYLLGDVQMRKPNPRDAGSLTMWAFGAAAVFWALVQPWWSFPWQTFAGSSLPMGAEATPIPTWTLATWMVVMGTVVPFWLVLVSLRYLRASQASVVGMTEPLLAIVIAWVALGEAMTAVQILGAFVVLGGVLLAERSR